MYICCVIAKFSILSCWSTCDHHVYIILDIIITTVTPHIIFRSVMHFLLHDLWLKFLEWFDCDPYWCSEWFQSPARPQGQHPHANILRSSHKSTENAFLSMLNDSCTIDHHCWLLIYGLNCYSSLPYRLKPSAMRSRGQLQLANIKDMKNQDG